MATKTYQVQSTLHHGTRTDDQRVYEPGDKVDLTDEQAARLLEIGVVTGPVKAAKPEK